MTATALRDTGTDALGHHLAWWCRELEGVPAALDLAGDLLRPAVRTARQVTAEMSVGSRLGTVAALALAESVPADAVALAAFQVLLWRHGAGDDFAVGLRGAAGPAARARLATGQPFRDVLRAAGRALDEGAARRLELAELVTALDPPSGAAHPLVQAVLDLRGIRGELLAPVSGGVCLDLALGLAPRQGEWIATLAGAADLFESDSVRRMLAHWSALLDAALADAGTPIDRLPLTDADEMGAVRATWDATARRFDGPRSLHERIAQSCRARPDATAVVGADGSLTFAELERRADRLARALAARGVGAGARVGLSLERSPAQVVAIYAILKAGGGYVPLDPQYPAERLAFMVRDAGVTLVVTRGALAVNLGDVATLDLDAPIADAPALPAAAPDPEAIAYVIYTSGSTGTPKGAAVPHRAAVNLALATIERLGWSSADRALQFSTVNFDFSVEEIFCSLMAGGTLFLRTDAMLSSMRAFLAQCDAWGITLLNLPTAFWHEVAAAVSVDGLALPPSVRALVAGGERMLPERAAALRSAAAPSVRLWNGYGPTEVTVFTTLHDVDGAPEAIAARSVPIGRPLANVRAYVLDGDREPVPFGVPGELYVGGAGVARGYLGRPELTAERFLPDPFAPRGGAGAPAGALMYRTGDRVRLRPSGELEYLGRLDDQVKIRGFRVELGEVEHALRGHPAVRDCAVVAREDVPGDRRLVAYAVASDVDVARLRAHLVERLPAFMVPAALVLLPALPVNANGKVDRRALPAPEYGASTAAEPPATPLERTLAGIFADVLGRSDVGVTDDFFAVGGHSLGAMRVLGRVAAATGATLPLRALFEAPTVRALAERIGGAAATDAPEPAIAARGAIAGPLTRSQEVLWLLQRTTPDLAAYNIPAAWRIEGALDRAALRRALDGLLIRHPVLRTTLVSDAGGAPRQQVLASAAMPLREIDLSDAAAPRRAERLDELMRETAGAPFDLGSGPPVRATLVRSGESEHHLLLTVHHTASDGWTQALLVRDLSALYAAARGGAAVPPAEPPTFADYAIWERERIAGARLEALLAFWRDELAGMPDVLQLPLDRSRPAAPSFAGGRMRRVLAPRLVSRLKRLAQEQDATLYMVLLAAFQTLLHRYGGQDDIVVGSPAAGRVVADVERMAGFFSTVVPQRASFADDPTFRALLDQVRERAIAGLEHQEAPLELIQAGRHPGGAAAPLLQAVLALHNTDEAALVLDGLTIEPVDVFSGQAKFELELALTERDGALVAVLEYRRELFDDGTVARLLAHFESLLAAAAADADRPVSTLPLLAPGEAETLAAWGTGPERAVPTVGAPELVFAQAAQAPDAVAVMAAGAALTYAELAGRIRGVAGALAARGVGTEVVVGIALERSALLPVAMLGTLASGGAYLPLDPAFPDDRLAATLADAGARVVLASRGQVARMTALAALAPSPPAVLCMDDIPRDGPVPAAPVDAAAAAYVIYTSGSTGRPKGVVVPRRALANLLASFAETLGVGPGATLVAVTTLSFDIATLELLLPLVTGGRLLVATREVAMDGPRLAALLDQSGATILQATPATWRLLVDADWQPRPGFIALVGGEALPRDLADALLGRGLALWNCYGPTETTIWSSVGRVERGCPIDLGRPIANTMLRVLDRRGQLAPIGVAGELTIGGAGVARGYHARPELTAERFVSHPAAAAPEARVYRTGDLARWREDGTLEFLGRLDQQIKVRGYRIELGEVEAALAAVPELAAAAVAPYGEGTERRLAAYCVAAPGQAVDPLRLRERLRATLPDYMIPAAFVALARLPLTANGKVDRKALPAPEAAPRPRGRAPVDWLERELAALWEEVLGVAPVAADDNFFELGGHSLLAARMLARAGELLGRKIPLATVLAHPTVEHLARSLLENREVELIVPLRKGGRTPLFWFHSDFDGGGLYSPALLRHLDPDLPVYAVAPHPVGGPATIEAMAADHVAGIRARQPRGPYRLGGFCFGALVAYAAACQLEREGETVDVLVMIDAYGENGRLAYVFDALWKGGRALGIAPARIDAWWLRHHDRLTRFSRRTPQPAADASPGARLQGFARLGWSAVRHALGAVGRRTGVVAAMPKPLPTEAQIERVERRRFYHEAIRRFIPRPYGGPVALLWSQEHYAVLAEPSGGWSVLTAPTVRLLPGDHDAMVGNSLPEVGAALTEILRAPQGETRSDAMPA